MNPELATRFTWRGRHGPSLRALIGHDPVHLDPEGIRAAFGETPATGATCIAHARWSYTPATSTSSTSTSIKNLADALLHACAALPPGRIALALSGGLDSAVLAALLRDRVVAYTLAPDLPGYSELEGAAKIADHFNLTWHSVPVRATDYIESLPAVIAACECPLYNLHPVSRHLLARAIRHDGHGPCETLITGDGADEVFRGTTGGDHLPIAGALTRAAGLRPFAPFLDPAVAPQIPRDPEKQLLRRLADALGVPPEIAHAPKRPRFTPPIDLSQYHDPARITALASALHRTPGTTDREHVAWTTLALFTRTLPGLDLSCVE